VIVFWLVTHSSDLVSLTSGWCTVPSFLGTAILSSHDGKPFDTSFCQNPFLSIPAGYLSMVIGRALMCASHDRGDGLVVRRQFALRDPIVRKQHLLWVRDYGDGSEIRLFHRSSEDRESLPNKKITSDLLISC
jgi:hypothetical protein